MKKWNTGFAGFLMLLLAAIPAQRVFAQADFKPWGNLDGIRVKGQLMEFNSRIVVVYDDWNKKKFTGKEMQRPKYTRISDEPPEVTTMIDSLQFTETMKNTGRGSAEIVLKCISHSQTRVEGIYFNLSLPANLYANCKFTSGDKELTFPYSTKEGEYFRGYTKGINLVTPSQSIQLSLDTLAPIIARNDTGRSHKYVRLYFPICSGDLHPGQVFQRTYEIKVSGTIDQSPVSMKLDTSVTGRSFEGLGGNFRIQNPKVDPEVSDYCLKNLRVAWGRVEMPWSSWQPDSSVVLLVFVFVVLVVCVCWVLF